MEWKWNGNGKEMEWKNEMNYDIVKCFQKWNGMETEIKWKFSMELKSNGIEMELNAD